jgi:hypothetical protein
MNFRMMLLTGLIGHAGSAVAQKCPAAPNGIVLQVTTTVKQDKTSGVFSYNYSVANGLSTPQEIETISIDLGGPVSAITTPTGWGHVMTNQGLTIIWSAIAVAPLAPGDVDDRQCSVSCDGFCFNATCGIGRPSRSTASDLLGQPRGFYEPCRGRYGAGPSQHCAFGYSGQSKCCRFVYQFVN